MLGAVACVTWLDCSCVSLFGWLFVGESVSVMP